MARTYSQGPDTSPLSTCPSPQLLLFLSVWRGFHGRHTSVVACRQFQSFPGGHGGRVRQVLRHVVRRVDSTFFTGRDERPAKAPRSQEATTGIPPRVPSLWAPSRANLELARAATHGGRAIALERRTANERYARRRRDLLRPTAAPWPRSTAASLSAGRVPPSSLPPCRRETFWGFMYHESSGGDLIPRCA